MGTRIPTLMVRELENQFVPTLRRCKKLVELKKIHAHIVKFSLSQSNFLVTKMVDVCDNNGSTDYATHLFKQVVMPNAFLYNAMIRTYTHNQLYNSVISTFKQMLGHYHQEAENPILPDKFTFPFVIKTCAALLYGHLGQQVHAQVCKFGPQSLCIIENALIDMYTKFDDFGSAYRAFELMTDRDVISWNVILSGHVRLGQIRKARALFDEMPSRTVVSWTTMLTGYARSGCYAHALAIFREMQMEGVEPDEISIISILPACAKLGTLEVGKWIHRYSNKNGFLHKTSVCNALIEMYSKCGCIDEAWKVFDRLVEKDVISWSTMIGGLANHGRAHEAIELFQCMQKAKVAPNEITFLGILSACSHAGLWSEGMKYFDRMKEDYHIEPEIEHYGCLIDLLGRAGQLNNALETIKKMPMKPDAKIWGSLLSSCRTRRNLDVAVTAMEHLLEFEPDDTGNYVLLSNIYAELGKWENVAIMRKLMRRKSMKKTPGCSLIEVNNVVQEFVSGDETKSFSQDIFCILEVLALHQIDDVLEIAEDANCICF